jgi:cytochrome c oxidase assembly protein subunit 15
VTEPPPPTSRRGARRDPLVGGWLLLICACVVAMVIVGGLTRLTDSGLSITEWRLGKGLQPPQTDARWAEEFRLYQQTTEYRLQNRGMSLAAFQTIYWWEWAHRFIGLMTGLAFALPFLAFWTTGRLKGRFWPVLGLFALGAAQAAIGWWMVESGLFGRLDVSPVRLAVHLGLAFAILAIALRLALAAFGWPRAASWFGAAPRPIAWLVVGALFLQVLLGALLAGNDAGGAYTDWPTIGGEWLPATWDVFSLPAAIEDLWALQFNHRVFGYVAALLCVSVALAALLRGRGPARGLALTLGGLALAQTALGAANVVTGSGLVLSSLHQAGAIALWLTAIALTRAVGLR